MKRILHYGAVLMIIALLSAGVLAYFNKKTESAIKEMSLKLENEARKSVFKDGIEFKEKEKLNINEIEYIPVYNNSGKKLGYVSKVNSSGYGGKIVIVLGIDNNKKITGIKVIESRETPGLGDKILNENWQKKWIGRDLSYEFNKKEDAFAGATISPRAVYSGMKKALENSPDNSSKINKTDKKIEVLESAIKLDEKAAINAQGYKFISAYDKDGNKVGCVVSCKTNGYNGKIEFEMGITADGKIAGVKITKSSETGGVGAIIEEKKWLDMWKGRDKNYEFNEETDCEAGATTSPRAVYKEMNRALTVYENNRK